MPFSFMNDNRFVAFIDLSGFKELMRKDKDCALKVIRRFFKIVFDITNPDAGNPDRNIQGLLISDCCVIWSPVTNDTEESKFSQFDLILKAVQDINHGVLTDNLMKKKKIMLKSSVAFGEFKYIETHKHELIQKEMIFGDAYIRAYEDNSLKLDPGLCRIVIDKKFPDSIKSKIEQDSDSNTRISLIVKKQSKYYYFWNCHSRNEIEDFWNEYLNSKNEVFKKMYAALSRIPDNNSH